MTVKAPLQAPPSSDRILRAILAILFSVTCFSILNAISKTLTQHYPVAQVVWARYVVAFAFMIALFMPRSGLKLFRWHNVGSQVIRGLLLFCSSFLYFNGLMHMPLASAASISLSSPLIVTALSARFLGEPVGTKRWIAVCVGFVGALIVVRPGDANFNWYALLIVASTISSSLYQLYSRRYGQTERPDASATMATIVGTVAAAPLLPFEWVTPDYGWTWCCSSGWVPWRRSVTISLLSPTARRRLRWWRRSTTCSSSVLRSWAMPSSTTSPIFGPGSAPG